MSWPVEKILEEAFKLDPTDRALVVAELSSSEGIATPEEVEALALEYRQIVLHAQEFPDAGAVEAASESIRIRPRETKARILARAHSLGWWKRQRLCGRRGFEEAHPTFENRRPEPYSGQVN